MLAWPSASALVSSRRAAVWTVIRADKRSVWRDSNEPRCFVPLLAHKHYIELFISFYRGTLYRDNYRYRIIGQPYLNVLWVWGSSRAAGACGVMLLMFLQDHAHPGGHHLCEGRQSQQLSGGNHGLHHLQQCRKGQQTKTHFTNH